MAAPDEGEVFQPVFPALETCLMIDPRHSTRQDLRRDLKASNLFENIVEAKSLDDGIRIVAAHRFDAVFLGASLTQEKAVNLLTQIVSCCFSKDCALLIIASRQLSDTELYITAGAHRVISIPCPRSVFAEGVVRGVVSANANSPWTGIVLNADARGENLFGEEKVGNARGSAGPEPTASPQAAPPPPPPVQAPPPTPTPSSPSAQQNGELNRATLNSVIAQSAPGLKQLKKQIESGECALEAPGVPNAYTQQVLDGLLQGILKNTDLDEKVPSFRGYFQKALVEWIDDVKVYGPTDATNELRKKLLAFKP